MALLVFGARGFLGARLSARLRTAGIAFQAFSRQDCDLEDAAALTALIAAHDDGDLRIVNLAVRNKADGNSPEGFLANARMTAAFVRAVAGRTVRAFVHASSFDVYGTRPPAFLDESAPLAAADWYGLAKITAESMLSLTPELRESLRIVRLPGVYDWDGKDTTSVVGRFREKLARGEAIRLEGGGSALRDLVCAADAAAVLSALALDAPKDAGSVPRVLNLGSGASVSVRELAGLIAARLGVPARLEDAPATGRSFDVTINPARLRTALPAARVRGLREVLSA